jgi:hypothetical protein
VNFAAYPIGELRRTPLLGTPVNRPSAGESGYARCHHVSAITLDHKWMGKAKDFSILRA